jgi:ABC-type transport system involved in multi-copper enzyme maturation permease subunit
MANVRPLTILTGKLAPRLASALLILVVQFPFTLLAITLGGVAWLQVFVAFCGLLAHTFLVGNIGLFCSVVFRRTGNAVGFAVLLVVAHFLIPALGYAYFSSAIPAGAASATDPDVQRYVEFHALGLKVFDAWYNATAAALMSNVLSTGFGGSALNSQVVSNLVGGAVIFVVSWLLFDVCNREVDVATGSARRTLWDLLRRKGRRSIRVWGAAAVAGREFRFAAGGFSAWVIKLLAYGPAAYGALVMLEGNYRRVRADDYGSMLIGVMLFAVLPLEAVLLASRVFRSEIKERTWSTLYMLPESLAGISYSKLAGAALALVPAAFYFFVGSVLDPDAIRNFVNELDEPEALVATFVGVANVVFLLHLVAWYSILTNSWVGILLAVVTWFATIWMWQICIMVPLMMGRMTSGPGQPFVLAMYAAMGCGLLAVSALLHWHVGVRLRVAAAA